MTTSFEVSIVVVDGTHGRLEGPALERVTKFLRISEGVPRFDLEYDGRVFRKCVLGVAEGENSLPFSFQRSTVPEPFKSDPNASYR